MSLSKYEKFEQTWASLSKHKQIKFDKIIANLSKLEKNLSKNEKT